MTPSEYEMINTLTGIATGAPLQLIGAAVGWYYAYHDTRNMALSSVIGLSLPDAIGFLLLFLANFLFVTYTGDSFIGFIFVFMPFFLFPGLFIGFFVFLRFAWEKLLDGSFSERTSNVKLYVLATVLMILNIAVVLMGYLVRASPLD